MTRRTMRGARLIRELTLNDVPALQAIDADAHGECWSLDLFSAEIERPDRTHLVADLGGTVVGHAAAWIDGTSCRITNVAVDSAHTGNGHATALLAAVLQSCLAEHRIMNVQLEVRPLYRRAQRIYSRFGFMVVGVESNFYDRSDGLGNSDALVMAVTDVCDGSWRSRLDQLALERTTDEHDAGVAL